MSIFAGFISGLGRQAEEKRSYIRERVDQTRQRLQEQAAERQGQVQRLREGLTSTAEGLRSRGMSEEEISQLIERDPRQAMLVFTAMEERNLSADDIRNVTQFQSDYSSDRTLAELIDQATPTFQSISEDAAPTERRRQTFAGMLGLDTEAAMQDEVYGDELFGGYTGQEIMGSLNAPMLAGRDAGRGVQVDLGRLGVPMSSSEKINLANNFYAQGDSQMAARVAELERASTLEGLSPEEVTLRTQTRNQLSDIIEMAPGPEKFNAMLAAGVDFSYSQPFLEGYTQIFSTPFFPAGAMETLSSRLSHSAETGPTGEPATPATAPVTGDAIQLADVTTQVLMSPDFDLDREYTIAAPTGVVTVTGREIIRAGSQIDVDQILTEFKDSPALLEAIKGSGDDGAAIIRDYLSQSGGDVHDATVQALVNLVKKLSESGGNN